MKTKMTVLVSMLIILMSLGNTGYSEDGQYGSTANNSDTLVTLRIYSPRLDFDGKVSEFDVTIDASLDAGDAIDSSGNIIASYAFYQFANFEGSISYILVMNFKNVYDSNIFLVNSSRDSYVRVAWLYLNISPDMIDLTEKFWIYLTKFFNNPLSLSQAELDEIIDFRGTQFLLKDYSFKGSFTPVYINRLFDAFEGNPNYKPTYNYFSYVMISVYRDGVPSDVKKAIIERLVTIWDTLYVETKGMLLEMLATGNSATMNMLGELILRYIDELPNDYPARYEYFWLIRKPAPDVNPIFNVIMNLGVDPTIRNEVVEKVLREFSNYYKWHAALDFIEYPLSKADGILLELQDYKDAISNIIYQILSDPYIFTFSLQFIFDYLIQYTDPSAISTLENYLNDKIANFNNRYASIFLSALNWPISDDLKNQIESVLLAQPYEQWDFNKISSLLYVDEPKPLGLSAQGRQIFLRKLADAFILRFNERPEHDNWYGSYDGALYGFIHFAKQSGYFEECYRDISLLLNDFNPQQPDESDGAYAARIARIQALWRIDRIFLYDLKGGTYKTLSYIDVISDFSKNHPDWVDVVVLATVEGGESKAGVSQFNWEDRYKTPYLLGESLLHEGGHALQERHEYQTRVLDIVNSFWYYEYENRRYENYASYNARGNTREHFAETTRYWHLDTKTYLNKALDKYILGRPALLNMFIFIWNMAKPNDIPPGNVLPLYKLNEDTGILEREYIPAWWEDGDFKEGTFKFIMDNVLYIVGYEGYIITGVSSIPVNRPPDISNIPSALTKDEGEMLSTSEIEKATDPDGDRLTYIYSGWLTSLPYTTTYDDAGSHTLHVAVSDGTDTAEKDIAITVNNVNHPPVCVAASAVSVIITNINTSVSATYADPDGYQDLEDVELLVNSSVSSANCVSLRYDRQNNKLYLRSDDGSSWLGGFAPRSNNIIENSFAKLFYSSSRVDTIFPDRIRVVFTVRIKPNAAFTGQKNIYLYAKDTTGAESGWQQKATVIIENRPTVVSLSPNSGTFKLDTQYTFTSRFSDLDGYNDLSTMSLLINTHLGFRNALYARYYKPLNELHLYNGRIFVGGYGPGSNKVIETPYGKLYCAQTSVAGSGANLTVNWSISFKTPLLGTREVYLSAYDRQNRGTGWEQRGNITIIVYKNHPPVLTPIGNKTVNVGNTLTFTISATDPDGDAITYAVHQAGDLNHDRWVTFVDRQRLWAAFGSKQGDANYNPEADLDNDGSVGNKDWLIFIRLLGKQMPVPEEDSFDSASGLFSWTPEDNQTGKHLLTFVASDGRLIDTETVSINVNSPPVLNTIGNKMIDAGTLLEFTISATDLDGDAITYSVYQAGDLNHDGWVTFPDRQLLLAALNSKQGDAKYNPEADLDNDGWVVNKDWLIFGGLLGKQMPSGITLNSASGLFRWTPGTNQTGKHLLTFVASDGRLRDTETVTITVIPDTTPPTVTITSPLQGATVSRNGFEFKGTAEDLSGVSEVRVYVYDYGRWAYTVVNQLATYDSDTKQWVFNVQSAHITPARQALLWVRAKDTRGNWSSWINRGVTVGSSSDTTAPTVAITSPAQGAAVSSNGFEFKGTAEDLSGVSEVRIYVYDYGRWAYTVVNQLATYNSATKQWVFNVQSAHITPGRQALLWVRAKDTKGNWSSWQSRLVNVQ